MGRSRTARGGKSRAREEITWTLYPVIMSASDACTKARHLRSMSSSVPLAMTCAPTMGRHPPRVNTVCTAGPPPPPASSPYTLSEFAICMTGSRSASGKYPLRPWHSMSNDSMRSGATFDHSPSGLRGTISL